MATWEAYQETMRRPASLWDAAKANDPSELGRLLDRGAAIDARDARGYSPLMLAAYHGNLAACAYLLGRGADVDSSDAAGNTVLMGAAFRGHHDIVRRLLAAGADRTRRNAAGLDAHGFAIAFGRSDIAALLGGDNQASTDKERSE